MSERIDFYRVSDPFGEFSNFAPFSIRVAGAVWPTSEHYFQGQKFADPERRKAIRETESPMIAARMGRSRKYPLRPDWEEVKVDIMREAVLAKFQQHPKLREMLLATEDAEIVEHTRNDSYWGDGGDGSGKYILGKILMEVREKLRG